MITIKDLRWIIAETLISWTFDIAPDDDQRTRLAKTLLPWLQQHAKYLKELRQ